MYKYRGKHTCRPHVRQALGKMRAVGVVRWGLAMLFKLLPERRHIRAFEAIHVCFILKFSKIAEPESCWHFQPKQL